MLHNRNAVGEPPEYVSDCLRRCMVCGDTWDADDEQDSFREAMDIDPSAPADAVLCNDTCVGRMAECRIRRHAIELLRPAINALCAMEPRDYRSGYNDDVGHEIIGLLEEALYAAEKGEEACRMKH